jgi:hypothetical protein
MDRRRMRVFLVGIAGAAAAAGLGSWVFAGLIPGSGPGLEKSDCYVELSVQGIENPGSDVRSGRVVLCHDGDPCDTDGVGGNDSCTFSVAVCIDQNDPNLPSCHPPTGLKKLRVPKLAQALPPLDGSACGSFVDLPVNIHSGKKSKSVRISANATGPKGTNPRADRDTFVLECLPQATP